MNQMQEIGLELAGELEKALPLWVETQTKKIYEAWSGEWSDSIAAEARTAGEQCCEQLLPLIRNLFESDFANQQTTPLAILRRAAEFPTQVLKSRGVGPVVRDEFAESNFPKDVYDLTPTAFLDFGPKAHDLGIAWGAAKAFMHLQQRNGG